MFFIADTLIKTAFYIYPKRAKGSSRWTLDAKMALLAAVRNLAVAKMRPTTLWLARGSYFFRSRRSAFNSRCRRLDSVFLFHLHRISRRLPNLINRSCRNEHLGLSKSIPKFHPIFVGTRAPFWKGFDKKLSGLSEQKKGHSFALHLRHY